MVGRLVEQQDVGTRQQEFGEFHPHEPTAAEGIERPLDPLAVETEAPEHALDPRLALEASAEFKAGPAVAVAVREIRGNFAARMREFFHLAFEIAQVPFERREFGKRRSDLRSHRAAAIGIDLLAQYRDANAAGYGHATRVRTSRPDAICSNVVLPAPLGPTNPIRSLRWMVSATSRNSVLPPKLRATPSSRSSITGSVCGRPVRRRCAVAPVCGRPRLRRRRAVAQDSRVGCRSGGCEDPGPRARVERTQLPEDPEPRARAEPQRLGGSQRRLLQDARFSLVELDTDQHLESLASEARAGLTRREFRVASSTMKWVRRSSEICELPEYYLTRAESEILRDRARMWLGAFRCRFRSSNSAAAARRRHGF